MAYLMAERTLSFVAFFWYFVSEVYYQGGIDF